MDFFEAMKQVLEGAKITRPGWSTSAYVTLGTDGVLTLAKDTNIHQWIISRVDMEATDWTLVGATGSC